MKYLNLGLTAVILLCGCSAHRPALEAEENRRAELELQSIREMVYHQSIPPVEFVTGSSTLLKSSYALLDRVAEVLNKHPRLKLIVEGHTDDVGGDEYNERLSLERAGSVKQYLASKGVYPDFIKLFGYGKKRPVTRDTTDRGRALNRRVEFKLTTRDWESVF